MQKGFSAPFLLIIIFLLISSAAGYLFFGKTKEIPLEIIPQITESDSLQAYTDSALGFQFNYSKNLQVEEDSEEEFNQRVNGDFRKNFTYYVTYQPAKFLGAMNVLDNSKSYEKNPLTVWVFDNPNNLSIDKWYEKYWYYPFVWGDYTARRNSVAPTKDATISGQLAKSGIVTYQPGSPKFVYLSFREKMFLFRIIGLEGEKILDSFNFLNDATERWGIYKSSEYLIKYPRNFEYSHINYNGVGGEVSVDSWTSLDRSKISIYSYGQDVKSGLEFKGVSQESTIYLAGEVLKRLTSEDGRLIHVGPINNYSIDYIFTYSGEKKGTETFNLMLSTFKFIR